MRVSMDKLLMLVIREATRTGRSWGLMYDLSGLQAKDAHLVSEDLDRLLAIPEFAAALRAKNYLSVNNKPLVALWGLGFSDRPKMFDEWRKLIDHTKHPTKGLECSVMLGVPTYWRSLNRDTVNSPELLEILATADVISPWSVGRYKDLAESATYAKNTLKTDIDWCQKHGITLLPVVFPGFSWHNLSKARGIQSPLDQVPRNGGTFLWEQFREFHEAGANCFFVAMFDELDEGTAIFKIRNDPPMGESPFVHEKGLSSDRYLKLTGLASRCLTNNKFPEWSASSVGP